MTTVSLSHPIPLPPAQVWPALAAFQKVDAFHPLVERVSSTNQQEQGVGAQRTCHFYDGTSVDETVLLWNEGQGLQVELSNFSMPLKKALATISLRALPDGSSQVTFEMTFSAKGGPFGWLMAQIMMKPMMRRMFKKVLKGLETHLLTGRAIGKDGQPASSPHLSAVA